MNYSKGDKVLYLPTSESAVVTKVVGTELVYIRMDKDKEEIPAFCDDVIPVLEDNRIKDKPDTVQHVAEVFYRDELKEGVYLIVQYKMGQLNDESMLPVFLYNHSNRIVNFDLNYYTNIDPAQQIKGKLQSGGVDLILHISFRALEMQPTFEFDWSFENIPSKLFTYDLVIRPGAFFKKYGSIAVVNSFGSMYFLQPNTKTQKKGSSLADYTRSERIKTPQYLKSHNEDTPSRLIREKAEFNPVLDLHIEKIHPNPNSLRKGEIIQFQLKKFDQFIEKAIRLKVNQIFIIHGVGNGKLKDEIATKLIQHHKVNTFKNEFNPSFGFGATEVWLY
ncbi:MAG: Smr/MutS family protein [Saprospiraceae bacterium]|nr:Smr/MutS family protein [Saprospiraceae bacterium]